MAKPMTKPAIIKHLATKLELPKTKIDTILFEISHLAYKVAKNSFTLPGIGKLVLVNRKDRMGRNPQTGAAIKIPAKRVLKFPIGKAAKDAVLGSR